MKRTRRRCSIAKEDRIARLHKDGYPSESIAAIVNLSPTSVNTVLRRYRLRWKYTYEEHYGRKRWFLSDSQVEDISIQYSHGIVIKNLATEYNVTYSTIYGIVTGKTYCRREEDNSLFDFSRRPSTRLL
jgi:transposase